MTKLPKIITIMLALLITYACGERSRIAECAEELALAEKLLDTRPDSVLSILREINIDSISDPAQEAKAYYLYGAAKRMLLDYPEAMQALLYAEKGAEELEDYPFLASVRRQLMTLQDSIGNYRTYYRYALSAGEAYEAYMEYDSALSMLNEGLDFYSDTAQKKKIYYHMSDLTLLCKDTSQAQFYDLFQRLGDYQHNFEYMGEDETLFDRLNNGGDWEEIIKCDTLVLMPNIIRGMAKKLFEDGRDSLACQLLECFCKYYTCTELGNERDDGIIHLTKKLNSPFPFNGTLLTRKNFFSRDIPAVERIVQDFYYEEIVIKEQTIRHQREMMVAVIIGCGLVICITVLIFRIINVRRRRREEILIQSAAELKTSLSHTHDKWLGTLTKLCDTYYDAYAKQSAKSKIAKAALAEINRAIDAPEFFTSLEQRVDRERDGLMAMMRKELPGLRDDEYRLLLLNALGYSVPTLALLMHESRDLIYTRRVRLRSKIQELAPPHIELFLKALE